MERERGRGHLGSAEHGRVISHGAAERQGPLREFHVGLGDPEVDEQEGQRHREREDVERRPEAVFARQHHAERYAEDLAKRGPAHDPARRPTPPVVREVVADVRDGGAAQHASGDPSHDADGQERVVADDETMEHESHRHDARAQQKDPTTADLVGYRSRDDGEDAHHQGIGRHQRAQQGLRDPELLSDPGQDRRDDHDLATGREDQQPEREDDEVWRGSLYGHRGGDQPSLWITKGLRWSVGMTSISCTFTCSGAFTT